MFVALLSFWDAWGWGHWRDRGLWQGGFAEGQGKLLLGAPVAVIGADDALDEMMANNVHVFEVTEADTFYPVENIEGFEEAGTLGVRQVSLGEVAGDDRLGVGAEAGDEHLHLLGGGVLGLVH